MTELTNHVTLLMVHTGVSDGAPPEASEANDRSNSSGGWGGGLGGVGLEKHYMNNQKSAESPHSALPMVMWPSGAEPGSRSRLLRRLTTRTGLTWERAQGNRNVLNLMKG